jgi:MOSC domain-containing protein
VHLAELWRYPVKSMAGERLPEARLGPEGVPGDRLVYVVDGRGAILSARSRPRLLGHRATIGEDGEPLVDGLPWHDPRVAEAVRAAAGPDARLVRASGGDRFDILPLLVATDGAIAAFGQDHRRLRPNLVIGGVEGLAERDWEWKLLLIAEAVVGIATLRQRCVVTTFDPDTLEQDAGVLRGIRSRFGGALALNAWTGRAGLVTVDDSVALREEPMEVLVPRPGRFVGR